MPTQPGTWHYAEKFGRFQGVGKVEARVDLPRGKVTLGSEGLEAVDDLDVELVGPDGHPVALVRPAGAFSEIDRGNAQPLPDRTCRDRAARHACPSGTRH